MDINDERRKKLEAGKEKLAAFRKKKAKVKKAANDTGDNLKLKDTVEPSIVDTNNASCLLADGLAQAADDHKEADKTSDSREECLPELFQTKIDVVDAKSNEESITEEFVASIKEETPQSTDSNEWLIENHGFNDDNPKSALSDVEQALVQRDGLIQQLTTSLKANADQQADKEDLLSEVLSLSQHVTQLQTQLQQADDTLQEQLQFHGISTTALQSAKTQMLQLQSIVHDKDKDLLSASQQLEKNNESLRHSKEENARLSQTLAEKGEEINNMNMSYDAHVSSYEEKQEKEEFEKSNAITEMKACIASQAKEIEDWKKSEEEWREKESHLKNNYEELVQHLQLEDGKGERLHALELELEELRRHNKLSQEEAVALKKTNEEQSDIHKSCLSQLEAVTDERNQLSFTHSNTTAELEALKSKNLDLEESLKMIEQEKESIRSELEALESKLAEEQKKAELFSAHQEDLKSIHSLDCDKLNNKINQLQSNLSQTKESLTTAENDLREEKDAMEALKQEVLSKDSSLALISQELSGLSNNSSSLHAQILSKDDKIQELENLLTVKSSEEMMSKNKEVDLNEDKLKLEESVAGLTKELNELRSQCDKYAEQIVQQQDETISANHVRGVQMSDKEYSDLKIIDQADLMDAVSDLTVKKEDELKEELEKGDENLAQEKEKCIILESQLQTLEDERGKLNETIKSLNDDICALKKDIEKENLQTNILGEELLSVNERLVETENSVQCNLFAKNESDRDHQREVDQYKSDIAGLQKDAEVFKGIHDELQREVDQYLSDITGLQNDAEVFKGTHDELNLKLTSSAEELEVTKENLAKMEESLGTKVKEVEDLNANVDDLKEKEKNYLENQEEMQNQLETTISQWQKLQRIVQDKEIELQNLQDDLDEQKRICVGLRKNHKEEIDCINSDLEALKEAKTTDEARIQELDGTLTNLQNCLDAKEAQFSETIHKLQSTDSSAQSLAQDLSDKETEMHSIRFEKEKLAKDLSDRMKDIEKMEESLDKAKNEIARLNEDLLNSKSEINTLETSLNSEREEKKSISETLESKNQQLYKAEQDLSSQIETLNTHMEDAREMATQNESLKQLLSDLESSGSEKDKLLSEEQVARQKFEEMLSTQCQNSNRLKALVSSLSKNVEEQEEVLVVNSARLQDLQSVQEDLDKTREVVKSLQTNLEAAEEEKESMMKASKSQQEEVEEMIANKNDLELYSEQLKDKLGKLESDTEKLNSETNELNSQIAQLMAKCDEKDKLLCEEQARVEQLTNQIDTERQQSVRLEGLLSSLSEDSQVKDKSLVEQGVVLEGNIAQLSQLENELKNNRDMLGESETRGVELETVIDQLRVKGQALESEITELRHQADKHDQDIAELTLVNKELHGNLTQTEQELKKRESEVVDLNQESEIIVKECNDLRAELQDKENENHLRLSDEIEAMKNALQTSNEEKELLKNNFDACLEEMQQKSSALEEELTRCKSQMTEELKGQHESQDEMKEMYTQQMAHMEDKWMALDREKSHVEKEMESGRAKLEALKDDYEHQVSELELNVQTAQSETMKLNDTIQKIYTDHDNELKDLKSLHELQTSELMENCLSLEKSVAELQKMMTDQANEMKLERNEMEQSFENLMSEMDEKKRRSDLDISRLKMQQDEMKKDHEDEMKVLEKKYETQLFDLEDRCSILTSEMERRKKSMMGVEGDFEEERISLENKIEGLENVRRELEIKCSILEDDITQQREQASNWEDEMKSILKTAAETESKSKSDNSDLKGNLASLKRDNKEAEESMRKMFESKLEDLEAENKHLKSKVNALETSAEMYTETKSGEGDKKKKEDLASEHESMKKQLSSLMDQNLSLKRRLLGQKSLEKKMRLSGVEGICPPLDEMKQEEMIRPAHMAIVTSTPTKKAFSNDEPYSPTAEEVSLIEGFFSESEHKPSSAVRLENLHSQKSGDEPDFVAEEHDRFQPEMVSEQSMGDVDRHNRMPNIHPIQEDAVTDGFQPEVSDQFFAEITEGNESSWPIELSVGMSPTSKSNRQQFVFEDRDITDGKEPQPVCVETFECESNRQTFAANIPDSIEEDKQTIKADELDKYQKQIREDLEEEFTFKARKQEQNIMLEYEAKQEAIQHEMEFHFAQKEQSIRNDWEKKFAKALQKMKKDFEKKLKKQQSQSARGSRSKQSKGDVAGTDDPKVLDNQEEEEEEDGMPDIEEGKEELGEVVEKLSKENQELAEVRDLLLEQIQISQAKGLHHRVQHQLQSMLSGREKDSASPCQDDPSTPTNPDPPSLEECVTAETVKLCSTAPVSADLDEDGSRTENSETSSVGAERLLEELEDISQQSCQDLPLEWELTNTIAEDANIPGGTGHQSIWEVFDSRCMRQDCQEVRHRYRKLCKCVVKSFGLGEDLMLEESGLLPHGEVGDEDEREDMATGGSTLTVCKGEGSLDDDDFDELLSDNVALESQLLNLAENMVLYKKAFVREKFDLDKENEFLRLELETNSFSKKELEKKFNLEKEEMVVELMDLKNQLALSDGGHKEKERTADLSNTSLLDAEDQNKELLEEKEVMIESLNQDIRRLKSGFEEMFCHYKDNTDCRLSALQGEVDDLKTENNYLYLTHEGKEETIARLQTEMGQHQSELEEAASKLSNKESMMEGLEEQMTSLKEENTALQSDLEDKDQQIGNLDKDVSLLKTQCEDLEKNVTLKDEKIRKLELSMIALKKESDQSQSLLAEVKNRNKEIQAGLAKEIEDLTEALAGVKSLGEDLVKNSSSHESRVRDLESHIASLEEEKNKSMSSVEDKEEMNRGLESEVGQLKSERDDMTKVLVEKQSQVDILESQVACIEDQHASLQSVCNQSVHSIRNLEVEEHRLEAQLKHLTTERDGLRVELDEKDNAVSNLQTELQHIQNQFENISTENDNLQQEKEISVSELKGETQHLKNQLQAVTQDQGKLELFGKQISELKDENNDLHAALEVKAENLTKSEQEIDILKSQSQELSGKLVKLQEENDKLKILEDQLGALKDENNNLQSVLEGKEEKLEKLKLEVAESKSEMEDMSARLSVMIADISRFSALEDELCGLKSENESLSLDQEEKGNIISKLEQEIDELKIRLSDQETSEATNRVIENMDRSNQELNFSEAADNMSSKSSDNLSSTDSSHKSSEKCSAQPGVLIEDAMVEERLSATQQVPQEAACEGRSYDQAQGKDFMVVEEAKPLRCPVPVDTSFAAGQEESFMSSTLSLASTSDIQDQALANELNLLKEDLRETRAIYSRENSLLREALEQEKKVKSYGGKKAGTESNGTAGNSETDNNEETRSEASELEASINQRLAVCLEQNKMLENENSKLRTKIRKQEAVVLIYKHRLSEKEHDSEMWRKSLTTQLQALQKQRDDLVQLLRKQEMGSTPSISEAIGQAAIKEESLRRVQDDLMEKMEELDHLHQMLTQRQVELQHCDMERRHLEQLCLLKDQTEMQLMKQKRLMEEQVSEIEHRLSERETSLMEEKTKLVKELKDKDERLTQMSQPQSPRYISSPSPSRSYSMGDLRSAGLGGAYAGGALSGSAEETDKQHLKAIQTLREKLKLEYDLRSSRLAESQASAVASYWMRHQNKNDATPEMDDKEASQKDV